MTIKLSPSEVLHQHSDLVQRTRDATFRQVVVNGYRADLDVNTADPRYRRYVEHNADALAEFHMAHIRLAETYAVSAEMMDVLEYAQAGLSDQDHWDASLAPTAHGIVHFDRPILVHDVRGKTMKAHWLVWGPGQTPYGPVTILTWYNDALDPDDYDEPLYADAPEAWPAGKAWTERDAADRAAFLRRVLGRWRWIGSEYRGDGGELSAPMVEVSEVTRLQLAAEGVQAADFGTNLPRYAHALWLLLNQTIAATERPAIERAARKRARRMNLPGHVSVIRLRRTEVRPSEGESLVEWQHRWWVRTHWAWRRCGPGHPGAEPHPRRPGEYRVRVKINAYVKGPEDKPLVQTRKLYRLDR